MKDKIKFGVIGCGTWGKVHAEIYSNNPYTKLIAVADTNINIAKEMGKKYSINYYTDYNQMLEKEELDAVGIATPDFAHADPIIKAANHNLNILCEKPLVTDEKEIEKVVEVINKKKVRIMVDYHNRWNIPFSVTKEKVMSGEIGQPINGYLRLNDVIWVPRKLLSWSTQSSIIWFLGSHTVDTLSWIFNDTVKRVYSVSHSGILKSENIDAVDTYMSTLEFKKGGIAQIENGWITPDTNPLLNDFKFNILCSKGMINMDLSSSNFFDIYFADHTEPTDFFIKPRVHGRLTGFVYDAIRDFIKRIYFDEEFIVTFEESVKVNQVLFAILKSAAKREPVTVNY